jgi:hypothetical protein
MIVNLIIIIILNQEQIVNMKVPANTIEVKYTSGNELVYNFNYKYYQGYYYEFNDRLFAGKEFNINALELIKADSKEVNTSLTNPKTFLYGTLSKIKPNNSKPTSIIYKYNSSIRYFLAHVVNKPLIIKEVNKETYNSFQNNSYYISVALTFDGGFNNIELEEAEIKMPGIKTFVNTSYIPPQVEESGLVG